ncbi:Ribosomal protein L25/Gln-tRNA synthetase [Hirschfeldia incana]|nr:Ribosomal protein L25/Gln-tRNA synthetase [Hirschfeldia incana]
MLLLRRATALPKTLQNLRLFSPAATSALPLEHTPLETQLDYLPGFPRPDAKHAETILAVPRSDSGKNISAKERKAGRVPSIIFEQEDGQHGGNKRLVSVQTNQIRKLVTHLGYSFFLSRLFDVEVRAELGSEEVVERVRALPRSIHLHSGSDAPLNVTFIRAPPGASLNTIKRTVKFLCPAEIIPPYIEVDLSLLDVGQKLVAGDLKVHPALKLVRPKDEPIVKIAGGRVSDQQKDQQKKDQPKKESPKK